MENAEFQMDYFIAQFNLPYLNDNIDSLTFTIEDLCYQGSSICCCHYLGWLVGQFLLKNDIKLIGEDWL